ncbi:MAG: Pycsar system effector family protein [Bacteroidota bacterium]
MTEAELLALKEEIKQEIKAEFKTGKKDKKKKGKLKEKEAEDENEIHDLFYTKSEPRKAFATFMRNQNKFYVNSFNIIDRKAAIMIRVNSTIISAIVVFFDYVQNIQYGTFIAVIMVLFSFFSMLFAINASRPQVFSLSKYYKTKVVKKYPEKEKNLFLLGMHHRVSLEEYEEAYDKLVKSQELQIGNQIRTMYAFEKQIFLSFNQIEIAYWSFMIGFSIVVAAFIIGALGGII